jgi:ABC-type xylose transport system substrate-binding protein
MQKTNRILTVVSAVALAAAALVNAPSAQAAGGKVAFLMPDLASTRYEQQDAPLFKAGVAKLCPTCEVLYSNADSDASKQQAQADAAITQGAKVLVLDAVDAKAAASIVKKAQAAGVVVITYDRPIIDAVADFYISFDNEYIGKAIAQSLVKGLDAKKAKGGILVVGGSPTDNAAGLIKKGMLAGVAGSKYKVLAKFDTPSWDPQKAQDWVAGQITQFKGKIVGVVAANDGTGGGSIAALKAAGVKPLPLVTGNDAEIAAVQRIIAGDQYNTISKPIKIVATAAAEAAVAYLNGSTPKSTGTLYKTKSQLFTPTVVTAKNIKAEIFTSGVYKASQVCTGVYAAGCKKLGIK